MAKNLTPEDVFTPKAVVSEALFERRNEPDVFGNPGLQDLLLEGLREKGAQLRVFGDTGVGKTSLVAFAAAEAGKKRLVVECMGLYDYVDLIENAIRKIRGVKLTQFTKSRSTTAEVEASGGFKFLASVRGKLAIDGQKERTFEIVDQPPLDLLIDLMKTAGYQLLVLDNFQNIASSDTRSYVAQTMETLSDRSDETGGIAMVVIGIAEDAKSLLGDSGSFRRRTTDIGVPRMPDDEIRSVLFNGLGLLDLSIDGDLLDHLVYFSDGFPFFAHLLGLNVGRAARRDERDRVTKEIVARALLRSSNEVDETYANRVRLAQEVGGNVQPKRKILELMAESADRSWTSNAVKRLWIDRYGGNEKKLVYIDVALGVLVKDEAGRILTRDEAKRPYIYRFEDPHFRPYLRLQNQSGLTAGGRDVDVD